MLSELKVPENIVRHIRKVTAVALLIATKLRQAGEPIDIDLVERAGFLHDAFKIVDIKGFKDSPAYDSADDEAKEVYDRLIKENPYTHEEAAFSAFKGRYPELAETIRKHKFDSLITDSPKTWEEKILTYSDKRVLHDRIVSLRERFIDGKARYPREPAYDKTRERLEQLYHDLEAEIFSYLDITPEDIPSLVS